MIGWEPEIRVAVGGANRAHSRTVVVPAVSRLKRSATVAKVDLRRSPEGRTTGLHGGDRHGPEDDRLYTPMPSYG